MNWNQLITDIRACGLKLKDISTKVGLSKGSVHELQNVPGRQVLYEPGAKLVALHKKLSRKIKKIKAQSQDQATNNPSSADQE